MQKKLLASVLAAGLLSSSTVLAADATAETMFKTVPKNHWAYNAVQQLVHDGLINGYGDEDFRGEKPISRFEMAKFVAMAMTNAKHANAQDLEAMNQLQQEYTPELTKLNVRIENLEKRTSSFKWFGDVRVRYQTHYNNQPSETDHSSSGKFEERLRLGFYGEPAENISVGGRVKFENNFRNNSGSSSTSTWSDWTGNGFIDLLNMTYHGKKQFDYTIGRQPISIGQGLIYWENPIDGVSISKRFGKDLSLLLAYGSYAPVTWSTTSANGLLANLSLKLSPKTTATLGYRSTNGTDLLVNGSPYHFDQISYGFNTQLSEKVGVIAEGIHNGASNLPANAQRNGWWTKLTYGHQDWSRAKTFEVYMNLYALGNWALDATPWPHRLDIAGSDWNGGNGMRGWGIGISYMLSANTNLDVNMYKSRPYDSGYSGFSSYRNAYNMSLSYSF